MPRQWVKPHAVQKNGKKTWKVSVPLEMNGGKRRRRFFHSEEDANVFATELNEQRASVSSWFLALPGEVQSAVHTAFDLMGARAKELPVAARMYIESQVIELKTVPEVVALCLESRKQMGIRASSQNSLKSTLNRFAEDHKARLVSEIKPTDIDAWLNSRSVAQGPRKGEPISRPTRRGLITDLRTLFSFAMSRRFCVSNPARAIERPAHEDMPRGILTVPQCRTLLKWVQQNDPGMLPCICLTLFAGIRPDEARWLSLDDLKGKEIRIAGEFAKGRQRRVVEKNVTLKAWLKLGGEFPPAESSFRERIEAIHAVVTPWPHDALRHSFISYRCPIAGIKTTAQEAAHSEDTLIRHYRAIVSKGDAEKFWALRPD